MDIYLFTFCHFKLTERVREIQTVFSFQTEPKTQKLSEQKPGVDSAAKLAHTFIFKIHKKKKKRHRTSHSASVTLMLTGVSVLTLPALFQLSHLFIRLSPLWTI